MRRQPPIRACLAGLAGAVLAAGLACAHGRGERNADERGERTTGRAEKTGKPDAGGAQRSDGKEAGVKPRPGAPRVPPTPEGLLGREAISELQKALADRRLLSAGSFREGELDAPTSAAVKRFQEQRGLAATGMPDRETLRSLGVSAEEAYGSSGGSQGGSR